MSSYRTVRAGRDTTPAIPNTYYPGSPTSSSGSSNDLPLPAPPARCQMHLHNMMKQGYIQYFESANAFGPREREWWIATVTITWSWNGLGIGTFQGEGLKKQAAREQASQLAIEALGLNPFLLK
ncbi:hypothetical protein FRB96_000391 [Tulasnella sp. 330]|nr:hypothetical protein FRB96_000391 [Tulasnella sp. 330]KAG8885336.1 hypothetical protein FRB97_001411 [Tulasnella sp. 331]KAG8890947.1 hypothetical protein FRB98_002967 [Tulasnella sp. 332]